MGIGIGKVVKLSVEGLKKLVGLIHRLATRPGMDRFIEQWIDEAVRELAGLIARRVSFAKTNSIGVTFQCNIQVTVTSNEHKLLIIFRPNFQ
jgi:hypothetical protein